MSESVNVKLALFMTFKLEKIHFSNKKKTLKILIPILLIMFLSLVGVLLFLKIENDRQDALNSYVTVGPLPSKNPDVKRTNQVINGMTISSAEKGNIDSPLSVAIGNQKISFTSIPNQILGGLNNSKVLRSEKKIIYENIYNGINLIYTPSKDKILEEYEVRAKRKIDYLAQKIDLTGLKYEKKSDGSIVFTNSTTGNFAFAVPKPVMYEKYNTKNKNFGLHYEIFSYQGNTYLVKVIDKEGKSWLEKSHYPVMIDATILLTLFSYTSYPTVDGKWQIDAQAVGSGDLTIKPSTGTTLGDLTSDLSNLTLTCDGKKVDLNQQGFDYNSSNFSCDGNISITTTVKDPAKQNSLNIIYSGYTTTVQSIVDTGKPIIVSSYIDPPVVKVGDTITINVQVSDSKGVQSVTAEIPGIDNLDLRQVSGTATSGYWQATWKVHDTATKPYEVLITASNGTSQTQSSIGFFDPYTCTGGGDHAGLDWNPVSDACASNEIAGTHTNIGTFSVNAGQTVSVKAFDQLTSYGIATISATTVTIASTGVLTANGKGWAGGVYPASGSGPGGGIYTGGNGGGGGYGGAGGDGSNAGSGGVAYGSLSTPGDLGSGGGAGNSSGRNGANGAGSIKITATGTLTVSGSITANGDSGAANNTGGGSGGSIYLSAATLAGGGTISSNGGSPGSFGTGGGGGGRIAVYYSTSSSYSGSTTVTPGSNGTAGTAFILNTGTSDLTIPSNNGVWNGSDNLNSWTFHDFTLNGGITFQPTNATLFTFTSTGTTTIASGITITAGGSYTTNSNGVGIYLKLAGNVTIPGTTTITANGKGYAGGVYPASGSGPGGGTYTGGNGGGGGYGGAGGDGSGAGTGGVANGSSSAPVDLGSGGGAGNSSGRNGANGGGAVKLLTTGTLTINGSITATGDSGTANNTGGGSGGSIYVIASTLAGSGSMTVGGGAPGSFGTGGGGGGRIAAYYNTNSWAGTTLNAATSAPAGSNGTNGTVTLATLYTCLGGGDHQGLDWDPATDCPSGFAGTHTNVGTLSVANGETATVKAYDGANYGIATISASTANIAGTITADGKGYLGTTTSGTGPGGGSGSGACSASAGGGGYGGTGGGATVGGASYGYLAAPIHMGSAGGSNSCFSVVGSSGGGAILLYASGTTTITGTVTANGNNTTDRVGGGSGGTIYISTDSLNGSGSITANGGSGNVGFGAGGGGRVAIYYLNSNSYSGTIRALGGTGSTIVGQNGTSFIKNSTTGDLTIPSNNGVWRAGDLSNWVFRNLIFNGGVTLQSVSANLLTVTSTGTASFASGITVIAGGSYTSNSNGVGVYLNLNGDITIPSSTTISANGTGYQGIVNGTGAGLGGGAGGSCSSASGGGYGGKGGGSTGGNTYGSVTIPVDLGSAGGSATCFATAGSAGGGAIKLSTNGTININGSITANGSSDLTGDRAGGGAGGSVYLTVGQLQGSGIIQAVGGNGSNSSNGGGGGGRISLTCSGGGNWLGNNLASTSATVGGSYGTPAPAAGTVYTNNCYVVNSRVGGNLRVNGNTRFR